MKNLFEYLHNINIYEAFNVRYDSKQEALDELHRRLSKVPYELEQIVDFLYDHSIDLVFDNAGKNEAKVKTAGWKNFIDFISDNFDSVATIRKKSVSIDNFLFTMGNGSVGKYTEQGDTAGQYAEALVCYFFNTYKSVNLNDKNVISKIEEIENNCGITIDDKWRESIKLTVEAINTGSINGIDWNNSNYVAVHTDQKDIELKESWAQDIAKIYSGRDSAQAVLGVPLMGIPKNNNKDSWNKADIILVKKNEKTIVNDIKNSICPLGSEDKGDKTKELNNILNSHVVAGDIIPISLKQITGKYTIKSENIPSEKEADISVEKAYLELPTKLDKPGYSGSLWLHVITSENLHYGIQFRSQLDTSKALSIEAGLPDNKNARGGKGATLIKSELGITKPNDKSYFANFKDLSDMCAKLLGCGFDIKTKQGKTISNAKELEQYFIDLQQPHYEVPIYDKTCFGGFVGIYDMYCNYAKNVPGVSDQLKFATNVLNKCTLGSGESSFFLIS